MIAGLCAVTIGCSDPNAPENMYEKYISRLSNVTEIDPPLLPDRAALPAYPETRDLMLNSEEIRVGLLDFLSFSECQLLHDISERNSGLGRVQQASVRLRYEMQFYFKLSACLEKLQQQSEPDEKLIELKALVSDVLKRKQKVLPMAYWNATWASPELRILLSSGSQPYQRDEEIPVTELNRDLGFLLRVAQQLYSGGPTLSDANFEQHYYRLQQNKSIGQWLQSVWISLDYLEQAEQILQKAEATGSVCPNGRRTQRANYLQNVFIKFYAGEVQPYLSKLYRAGQSLLPQLAELRNAQTTQVPTAFEAYYRQLIDAEASAGLWKNFLQRMQAHTRAWQGLLKQCGMMPGSESDPG